MKVLCVCESGHVRSVTLARLLAKRGHEAFPLGVKHKTALPRNLEWADRIYAMDVSVFDKVAALLGDQVAKLSLKYAVGPDDWKVPDHPDLLRRLRNMVEWDPPSEHEETGRHVRAAASVDVWA